MPVMSDVNGADLYYNEQGSGSPLVFVHGSLGDYRTFEPQFAEFSKRYRIISYSRRFHPPNPWVPGDVVYSGLRHADDLAVFVRKLGLSSVYILASSYGAYTALLYALSNQANVRAMVLGEPPILPMLQHTARGQALATAFGVVITGAREAFARDDLEAGLRFFVDGIRGGSGAFDRISPEGRVQLLNFGREMQRELLTADAHYFPGVSREQLKGLNVPTLLVTGQLSPAMFHVITDEIEASLPRVRRVEIPDAGHSMHSTNPEFYNNEVLAFLSAY